MRLYLASRFSRMDELNGYADQLRANGFTIDARWLTGEHGVVGDRVEAARYDIPMEARTFANDDVEDIQKSNGLVFFSQPPCEPAPRGGRHFEMGLAYGLQKNILVVGPRENIFHTLVGVDHVYEWDIDEVCKVLDKWWLALYGEKRYVTGNPLLIDLEVAKQ